ncbi:MAG: DUF1598 domain-containing protein [Planctomycetes bacterium]|nr:DUF1598 domain-containing protein [Planctomycetota bacterium]
MAALCYAAPTKVQAQFGGVLIKGDTLHTFKTQDPNLTETRRRFAEARASLDRDVARKSELRFVSLPRLEAVLAERIKNGRGPTETMKYLAGLTRIQYVFFIPETKDIVIAGPAEGWATVAPGRVVGIESQRATLELQDLVAALRLFPAGSKQGGSVSCSIDPTKEGLAKMQSYMRSHRPQGNARSAQQFVEGLKTSLGLHTVSIRGIPADTHAAQVLVEADYRMKLIGIGVEKPAIKLRSWVDRASGGAISRNAMQRWYFVPNYECVRVSDDGLAMQLVGDGVKLIGADEVVLKDGQRVKAKRVNSASQKFTSSFTKMYPQLADKTPIFAQLRNLIDLFVAAAFIQDQDYYGKAGWSAKVLGDEKAYPIRTYQKPVHVEAAAQAVWKGRRLLTPVGGGVIVRAKNALKSTNLLSDEDGRVAAAHEGVDLSKLPKGKWWWDAK